MKLAVTLLCASALLPAADWVSFRAGPVEVWTNASDENARKTLAHFDQMRWLAARLTGKTDVIPLWTVRFVLFKPDRSLTSHRTPSIRRVRNLYIAGMPSGDALPLGWSVDFARLLLNDDIKPLPAAFEDGLVELLSGIQVKSQLITVGHVAPGTRMSRDYARLHLLGVDPNWSGRLRVFLSNLQQGAPLDTAYRNSFEKTEQEMEVEIDSYLKAGQFPQQTISGRPVNLERDYRPRQIDPLRAQVALADLTGKPDAYRAVLNAGAKDPDAFEGLQMFAEAVANKSESAPAWLAASIAETDKAKSKQHLERAAELNPRWAATHLRFAEITVDPAAKLTALKKATELEPRHTANWRLLARAQTEAKDFKAALDSWRAAERSTSSPAERAAIAKERESYEQQRFDLEAAERRRIAEEKAAEIARLRDQAMQSIRAAEAKANAGKDPLDPNRKVVEWWDGPRGKQNLEGTLEKADCLGGPVRLHIRAAGKLAQYLIADPSHVSITGGDGTFTCGIQKPPRKLKLSFDPRQDPKHATTGDVAGIEFP